MQQQDFRNLIERRKIPRVNQDKPEEEEKKGKEKKSGDGPTWKEKSLDIVRDFDKEHKKEKRKAKFQAKRQEMVREKRAKVQAEKEKEEGGGEIGSNHKYRDRALERRKGEDEVEQQLQSLTAEQTRFLSGDTEFTGAVHGLDYVLLKQQRERLEKEEQEKQKEKEEEQDERTRIQQAESELKSKLGEDDKDKSESDALHLHGAGEDIKTGIRSALARNLVRLLEPPKPDKSTYTFIPGHYYLRYKTVDVDVGVGVDPSKNNKIIDDIPVSQFRSLADCPKFERKLGTKLNSEILEVLSKASTRLGLKRKKHRSKGKSVGSDSLSFSLESNGISVVPLHIDTKKDLKGKSPESTEISSSIKATTLTGAATTATTTTASDGDLMGGSGSSTIVSPDAAPIQDNNNPESSALAPKPPMTMFTMFSDAGTDYQTLTVDK